LRPSHVRLVVSAVAENDSHGNQADSEAEDKEKYSTDSRKGNGPTEGDKGHRTAT